MMGKRSRETMQLRQDGYETMRLRRGKPARTFRGTHYLPGVPLDPTDPNISDPVFRLQLERCRVDGAPPRPVPPPLPASPMPSIATPAAMFEAEERDQALGDEGDERN